MSAPREKSSVTNLRIALWALRSVVAWYEADSRRWLQRRYSKPGLFMPRAMMPRVALRHFIGLSAPAGRRRNSSRNAILTCALSWIRDAIDEPIWRPPGALIPGITTAAGFDAWNDQNGRTLAEVLAVLRRAIEFGEEELKKSAEAPARGREKDK